MTALPRAAAEIGGRIAPDRVLEDKALLEQPAWTSATFYALALAMALVTLWIAYGVYRSKLGTGLFAIHDDEDVAEVMGVPTFRYKLQAFGLSCGLAGTAGGVHAMFISYVTVGETFSIIVPLTVVLMSVLGGARHWLGPAVGATVITGLLYAFTAGNYPVAGRAAVGLILIVVILFLPQGLLGRFIPRLQGRRSGTAPVTAAAVAPAARPPGRSGSGTLIEIRGLSKAFKSIEGGKPIRESRDIDVPLAAAHLFNHAGWADKLEYAFPGRRAQPLGVAAQVIPGTSRC